jgi:prepilin-type N-terminal cleavage/methylation domain-containing protein/prepilin-type processing-associated H-X9-DG protein
MMNLSICPRSEHGVHARAGSRKSPARYGRAVSAFTLIELLVVIAIIAILAAILFPVFAQARAKARQAACLSNMKQISIGLMMYTQDYDEVLAGNDGSPGDQGGTNAAGTQNPLGFMEPDPQVRRNWARDIQPYIKNLQVYVCPNAIPRSSFSAGSGYAETNVPGGGNLSYLINGITSTKALAVIPAPADIIYIREYAAKTRVSHVRPHPDGLLNGVLQYRQFNHGFYEYMHNEGSNLLYCDGHVKWKKKVAVKFRDFGADTTNLAGGPDRTFQDATNGCTTATCAENSLRLPALF